MNITDTDIKTAKKVTQKLRTGKPISDEELEVSMPVLDLISSFLDGWWTEASKEIHDEYMRLERFRRLRKG
jgi:hypothetical protein